MKPSIKSLPRIFASADWNLWILRTIAVFSIALAIGWKWSPLDEFSLNSGLILQLFLGTMASLATLHLITTIYFRRNSGSRFLALNINYALLSISLPVSILLVTHHQEWELNFDDGNQSHYLEDENSFELAITQKTILPKNKVWVINWDDLETNKLIQVDSWSFKIIPKLLIRSASFGTENSKKIDKYGKYIAGVSATAGYALNQNLRMFSATKTNEHSQPGGLFEIKNVVGNKHTSYLLAPNIPAETISSPQSEINNNSSFTIQLRKKRFYPGFSMSLQSTNPNSLPLFSIHQNGKELHSEKIGHLKPVHFNGFTFIINPSTSTTTTDGIIHATKPYGTTLLYILFSMILISGALHSILELNRRQQDSLK